MDLPIFKIKYHGDSLKFLEKVNQALVKNGIKPSDVLYRASKKDRLEKILKYGTDRGGYPGEKLWKDKNYFGKSIPYENIIYASTESEIRNGEKPGSQRQTSFKKFKIIDNPLLLIYNLADFAKLSYKQYKFNLPAKKVDSLLAIIYLIMG